MAHVKHIQIISLFHTTVSLKEGGGGELDRTSTFRVGLLGKTGVTFFRGGVAIFTYKNKLKYEIFNDKKSL